MTAGVTVSAACFVVALVAELLAGTTGTTGSGALGRVTGWLSDLDGLDPEAWASLGTLTLVVTPALGLVASAAEYARAGDRRTVGLAMLVLAVLAASAVVAVRG
jgi:uncharacterized membrane protein